MEQTRKISLDIPDTMDEKITKLSKKEKRKYNPMLKILIEEALENRKL